MSANSEIDSRAAGYAPFAQLVKMLVPSSGCLALYGASDELLWCSNGCERPDLRELLDQKLGTDPPSSGRVEQTASGIPVFIAALRGADTKLLGAVIVELGESALRAPSMVVSMLRPVLDCLASHLGLEGRQLPAAFARAPASVVPAVPPSGDHEAPLASLVEHTARGLGCLKAALLVPRKSIELVWHAGGTLPAGAESDRAQKHLFAWIQLNSRPLLVNRAANAAHKILSTPLRDPGGRISGFIALFRAPDADDFQLSDQRVLDLASHKAVAILVAEVDALTGLPNRATFERRAQQALATAPAALLYIDIDRLSAINAAYGFAAGDEVIQRVADLIRRAAGAAAHVGRVAGDCFGVLLANKGLDDAAALAQGIAAATSQLGYVSGSDALPVSVGVGVVAARAGAGLAHLLAAAELACHNAKLTGPGRCLTTPDADQSQPPTLPSLSRESSGLELEAQPIVSLEGHGTRTIGYELLIRLRGAAGELLAPGKFFGRCEQHGLLPALDRWVLAEALDTLRQRPELCVDGELFFSLNVSGQSLENRGLASFLLAQIRAAGLSPASFCFEIKESAAVATLGAAEAFIDEVTKAGAKVALDDFGSGVSSLAHLKHLPVTYLKIDGRFVRGMLHDRVAESIVAAIAAAAETLGMVSVAEHVEDSATAERLRALGVSLGQGFRFGRPTAFSSLEPSRVERVA